MSKPIIEADRLSKLYEVGTLGTMTIREAFERWWYQIRGKEFQLRKIGEEALMIKPDDPQAGPRPNTFWALKDASFQVNQGDVVGIIGRNGAGKSTLLKILSKITEPTSGRAVIRGRIGSLLEVGTGFHPDLTGRQNIYLNGAILGMRKKEIDRKFDQIVAFSEIEKFIDTPVKHYSSGMYVRLAFSVAAHLDPDILIIDEVLSVGDAGFQEKCLALMKDTAAKGKTILFVSHSEGSVQDLCSRVILFDLGKIAMEGSTKKVLKNYSSEFSGTRINQGSISLRDWVDRETNGQARITHFEITDGDGQVATSVAVGGSLNFSISAEFSEPLMNPNFGVLIHSLSEVPILDIRSHHAGLSIGQVNGEVVVKGSVENLGLYPGDYFVSPWISDAPNLTSIDWVKSCTKLHVYEAPGPNGGLKFDPQWGRYWVPSKWSTNGQCS